MRVTVCACDVCVCTVYTLRACGEEGTGPPDTAATDVIRNHVGSKNWTQAPWKSKHPVPLTTEPPLQPQLGYFKVELQECPKWRISIFSTGDLKHQDFAHIGQMLYPLSAKW